MSNNTRKNIIRAGIYARVSTADQQTLSMQIKELREYAKLRKWRVVMEEEEIGSAAHTRPKRELLLKAARQCKIDNILVWKLDRWGRSLTDVFGTLDELNNLGVGFVSLTEALDLNTITGTAMAGLLTVFAKFERDILRERVKAGIAHARKQGKPHGRPKTVAKRINEIKSLFQQGFSKSKIAKTLSISRTSVTRLLSNMKDVDILPVIKELPTETATKTITVILTVNVENNNEFVRGKSKSKQSIEFYLIRELNAEKLDDEGCEYRFTVSYENDEDLENTIYDILGEIENIADYRHCFTESSITSEDGTKFWD